MLVHLALRRVVVVIGLSIVRAWRAPSWKALQIVELSLGVPAVVRLAVVVVDEERMVEIIGAQIGQHSALGTTPRSGSIPFPGPLFRTSRPLMGESETAIISNP